MKKIQHILLILGLSFCLSSCDLDTAPTNFVPIEDVYTNIDNIEAVFNGAWRFLWEYSTVEASPGFHTALLMSDAMGSDVNVRNGYGYNGVYQFTIAHVPTSHWISRVWENAYKTIDNCNNILLHIDGVEGDADKKKRIKAQTLALRGYAYLNLASFYSYSYSLNPSALCVPIYTEPTTLTSVGKSRSSLHDVYERARLDLEAAYDLIDPKYDRKEAKKKWKIDKSVICGILARTYLHMGIWDKAATLAAEAHANYKWMFQPDYLGGFNDVSNSEWMWGQPQTTSQYKIAFSWRDVSTLGGSSYYAFFTDPYFKDELFPNGDDGDIRYELFEWDVTRYKGALMYKKFRYRESTFGDYVFMRKAEMILIEAEALAEQGESSDAITKLNELRSARGAAIPDLSSFSKDDLVEEILKERRKELWGEGFSLTDIIRRQKAVDRREYPSRIQVGVDKDNKRVNAVGHWSTKLPDGSLHSPNNSYYLFAIPQNELNTNPNL